MNHQIKMPKKSNELSREDLIALIEERAEDVCGGKMYEVEVRIDELEEDLEASKENVKNLEQSLKQAQSDLETLSKENKQLKGLVNTLQENKELRSNNEVVQLKKEIDVLKKEKPVKSQASEIKKLRQEVEELKVIREENNNLKEENNQVKLKFKECQSEIGKLKWSRDGINKELAKKASELENLKHQLDCMDQKQRETRVRVTGMAEEEGENLTKKLLKLAKNKMGLKKFKDTDVVSIHRSGKKKPVRTRDIIVQFDSKITRDSFHEASRKLQGSSDVHKNIYVNDDLTNFRSKLLFDAHMLVRRKKLKGAWSQSGNIMVLRENEKPCAIYCYNDLRKYSGMDFYGEDTDGEHTDGDEFESVSYSTC